LPLLIVPVYSPDGYSNPSVPCVPPKFFFVKHDCNATIG
jgi:hypothetical protein